MDVQPLASLTLYALLEKIGGSGSLVVLVGLAASDHRCESRVVGRHELSSQNQQMDCQEHCGWPSEAVAKEGGIHRLTGTPAECRATAWGHAAHVRVATQDLASLLGHLVQRVKCWPGSRRIL